MSRDDEEIGDDDEGRALEAKITGYMKLGLPALTLIVAIAAGVRYGASAVVLTLAAGTLLAGITVFWASLRTLVGETPLSGADAYALGAPRAEEEQKRAVLRALKDLEFERSVGKISDEDYKALVERYRAEAKRLLRVLDEGAQPEREKVEALVMERLAREGLTGEAEDEDESDDEADEDEAPEKVAPPRKAEAPKKAKTPKKAKPKQAEAKAEAAPRTCAKCGTKNDADAVLCKKCGAKQGAPEDDEVDEDAGEGSAS